MLARFVKSFDSARSDEVLIPQRVKGRIVRRVALRLTVATNWAGRNRSEMETAALRPLGVAKSYATKEGVPATLGAPMALLRESMAAGDACHSPCVPPRVGDNGTSARRPAGLFCRFVA